MIAGRIKYVPRRLHWEGHLEAYAWFLLCFDPSISPFTDFNLCPSAMLNNKHDITALMSLVIFSTNLWNLRMILGTSDTEPQMQKFGWKKQFGIN